MNRHEFAKAVKQLDTKPYRITVNAPSDGAWQRGCYLENGIWKVYETNANRRMKVLYQNQSEEAAFAWLYQLLTAYPKNAHPKKKKSWFPFGGR